MLNGCKTARATLGRTSWNCVYIASPVLSSFMFFCNLPAGDTLVLLLGRSVVEGSVHGYLTLLCSSLSPFPSSVPSTLPGRGEGPSQSCGSDTF